MSSDGQISTRANTEAVMQIITANAFTILVLLAFPISSNAQTDEIQVYDASIASQGAVELTLHGNYTPRGSKVPAFRGGVVPDHSTNGAFEWAYGLTSYAELGLYFPIYTVTGRGDPMLDGGKLRLLVVSPNARKREIFYGVNFEFSYNARNWAPTQTALEVRPIVGLHEGRWDLISNPILDSDFRGVGNIHFAPAERVAYGLSKYWEIGIEHYGDLGPMRQFDSVSEQSQSLFAIVDLRISEFDSIEFGAGYGLTPQTDRVVLKLILNHEL